MSEADNIAICHRCRFKKWIGDGILACETGHNIVHHARSNECPHDLFSGAPYSSPVQVTPEHWGPPLWAELEAWAASADLSTVPTYLDAFALRVPCGPCREHWRGIVAARPPDVSSNAALVLWVRDRHNDVNRLLGKPIWALDAGLTGRLGYNL